MIQLATRTPRVISSTFEMPSARTGGALGGQSGEIYNVSSEAAVCIADLLAMLSRITGHAPRIEPSQARIRYDERAIVVGDSVKLRTVTPWTPDIDLEQSVRDMLVSV